MFSNILFIIILCYLIYQIKCLEKISENALYNFNLRYTLLLKKTLQVLYEK